MSAWAWCKRKADFKREAENPREREVEDAALLALEMQEGPQAKVQVPPEAGECKGTDSPQELPEGSSPVDMLILGP